MVMGTVFAFGQKNTKDESGQKHGFWTELHPNSRFKRYEGNFDHGTPVGEFKRYYQTGQLESKVQYRGDSTFIRSFFMEGGLLAEGIYINQKKEGKWKFYSGNGFLISEEFYTAGVRNGESIVYSEKGKVVSKATYANGTLNGPFFVYYPNGVIKEERTYANGKNVGKEIKRYPNNKIMTEGVYNKEGFREGWYVEYLPSGEEKVKYLYTNGIGDSTVYVNGTYTTSYGNENTKSETTYHSGFKHDWEIVYANKMVETMETEYDELLHSEKKVLVKKQPIIYKARYQHGRIVEGPFYYSTTGKEISAKEYDLLHLD